MRRWGNITIDIDFIGNRDQTPVYSGILRQLEKLHSAKKSKKKGGSKNGTTSSSGKLVAGGNSSGGGSSTGGKETVVADGPLGAVLWKQVGVPTGHSTHTYCPMQIHLIIHPFIHHPSSHTIALPKHVPLTHPLTLEFLLYYLTVLWCIFI